MKLARGTSNRARHQAAGPLLRDARVVLLTPVLDFGGVETRVVIQAEGMRERIGDLRVCTLWRPGAAAERLTRAGVPVDSLEIDPRIRNVRTTLRLSSYLRQLGPDLIHARIAEANWHGMLAGASAGVPCRIAEEVGLPRRGRLSRLAFPLLYRSAHRVVGVSEATCRFLLEVDGVPADKVTLVYNTAKPAFFEAPPTRTRPADTPFRILAVGRLDPVKNLEMLIRAFAALHVRFPRTELLLIGEGPSRPVLEALVRELGLGRAVRLLGFREDVRPHLSEADLYVLPSRSEGFGIALVEAMACEIPVLGSAVGGVVEVMGDLGRDYLLSPFDEAGWIEAMARILVMPAEDRAQLGREGRRLILERFSPDAYINNLTMLYETLLAQRCERSS